LHPVLGAAGIGGSELPSLGALVCMFATAVTVGRAIIPMERSSVSVSDGSGI
jgi:hypothetical protein